MHKQIRKLVITGVALGVTMPVVAQDDDQIIDDINAVSCISLRSVRRTEVVDDRNILFYMRGNTVYHNILPTQCGGLARENRFAYKTTIGRLCDLDRITVLYSGPYGISNGNSCRLGKFHKISREDADAIKEAPVVDPTPNPLPMPAPQEIDSGEDESDETEPLPL